MRGLLPRRLKLKPRLSAPRSVKPCMTISRKVVVTVQRIYLVKELVLEGLGGKENFKQVMAKVRAEVKALSDGQVSYAVVTV